MTQKPKIIHYDLFGNKLNIENIVIFSDGNRGKLHVGKILRFTKKMVEVSVISKIKDSYITKLLRYPADLVLVDDVVATEYILTKT